MFSRPALWFDSTRATTVRRQSTLFRSRLGRRLGALVIGLLTAAAVLPPTTGAAAHESFVSSSPAEGETVTTALAAVTISFSAEPLTGAESASFIEVKAPDKRLVSGPTVADGVTLRVPVNVSLPGEYEVAWRYVSGDGHPISGVYTFDYAGPANGSPEPTTPPNGTAKSGASDTEDALAGIGVTELVVIFLLVLVLILVVSWVLFERRRKS